MTANDLAPGGTSDQCSSGETSDPSQVNFRGTVAPLTKDRDSTVSMDPPPDINKSWDE